MNGKLKQWAPHRMPSFVLIIALLFTNTLVASSEKRLNVGFASCENQVLCESSSDCTSPLAINNTFESNCGFPGLGTVDFKVDLDDDGNFDLLGSNINPYPFPNPGNLPILTLTATDNGMGGFDLNIEEYDFPVSTHRIFWELTDPCQNDHSCEYLLEVQDCTKPVVKANHGLAIDIHPIICGVTLTAEMMNDGSYDNCCLSANPFRIATPWGDSGQVIPPSTTDVHFMFWNTGTKEIDFWVQDCNGNWDYERTYVNVQSFPTGCDPMVITRIIGNIKNEAGVGIANVPVNLDNNGTWNYNPTTTNEEGNYYFHDLEYALDYVVYPEQNENHRNGVSTLDIILISRHLIGLQTLGSPYKMIAADVDNSGSISTFDLLAIQRLILYIDLAFANNTSWRFVPDDHVFSDLANPWSSTFPEEVLIEGLFNTAMIDFIGIKVGDVSGNAKTDFNTTASDRSNPKTLNLSVAESLISPEEEYTLDIRAQDLKELYGYQMALDFDPTVLEILEVIPSTHPDLAAANFGLDLLAKGMLTANLASADLLTISESEVLFSVKFKAMAQEKLSRVLQLNTQAIHPEVYNENFEVHALALNFEDTPESETGSSNFILFQNQPNPFQSSTTIGFALPRASTATLTIYEPSGKILREVQGDFSKGYQEIALDKTGLPTNGLFYYQLQWSGGSAIQKMILVE